MRIVRITLRAASRRISGFGLVRPPFLKSGLPCRLQVAIDELQLRGVQLLLDRTERLGGGAGRIQVVLQVMGVPGTRSSSCAEV